MGTRTSASLLAAAGCLVLAPGAASAATLTTGSGCYATGAPLTILGSGWTPGEVVNVSGPGIGAQASTDPAGNVTFSGTAPRPFLPSEPRRKISTQTLTANNIVPFGSTGPNLRATGQFDVTNKRLSRSPNVTRPSRKVRWRPTGFAPQTPLFVHAVLRGKARRSVPIGAMPARCATVPTATRLIPVTRPAKGRWTLQVDASPAYDPGAPGNVRTRVRVRR